MRVAVSLLILSMALFLPDYSKAAETAPADTTHTEAAPAPVRSCPKFSWYKRFGRLSLDRSAEGELSRRDQAGQYVYLNGGEKGFHFVAEIAPDFSPGLYLHTGEPGTVVGELSLLDPETVSAAAQEKGQGRLSFFLGPDLSPAFEDGLAAGDAANMRVMEDGPDKGPDIGVRCGIRFRLD